MISPSNAFASATESVVLPLAVGPPTATTRGLDKSAKLLFQLLPENGKIGTDNEVRLYDEIIVQGTNLQDGKLL